MESAPPVSLDAITKSFPSVIANDAISLTFLAGEIHVLLGENGAGKSTLMAILAGMQRPDSGKVQIRGKALEIASPRESLDLGIGTVFQHVLLVPSLTVLENLMLGGPWWARQGRTKSLERFCELRDLLAIEIDPDVAVQRLSLGQQQQVEIMRALWRGAEVLILDEPTSMLTPQGVRELGQVMRRLRDQGVAIIFITHKLKEAYDLGDRISILRLGRVAGEIEPARLEAMSEQEVIDEVVRLMFGGSSPGGEDASAFLGKAASHAVARPIDRAGAPLLRVQNLTSEGQPGSCPLLGASFEVWPGEVFGIAGVDGNGQKHLAEVLAGQRPATAGNILLDGREVTALSITERHLCGLRYITDERLGEGTIAGFSVAANLLMKNVGAPPYWSRGITLWDRIFAHAREEIRVHDIRTPSEHTPIGKLSGGNIQKVLLARELTGETRLAIFNKPTYGLDLHNTRLARRRIAAAAEKGTATIVISTELDELMELCDRIAVLYQGRLQGIVENGPGAEKRIGLLMTGGGSA
jgi:ABC-type uncharacterized transport system ATPase subunit